MAKSRNLVKILWGISLGNGLTFIFLLKYASNFQRLCLGYSTYECGQDFVVKNSNIDFNLIMIGVMTAPKYLETRAKAVYQTWGREAPGDIKFYSSQGTLSSKLPLISLKDVDDSYPPQKKSLMMLKHMHDNYINTYEWFMRADDDVYIRPDRLEALLRSVDSRRIWFIGQTGRGNSEEFGLLSLNSDENFCMGGPGVIFSRETLRRVAPFIDECLRHLYTSHEDVELGRCVRRFAGASCTWSYQMQVIFYHNQSGYSAFTGELKQKEIHEAITLHPVKHPESLYRLHKYFKGLKIRNNLHHSVKLNHDLYESLSQSGYDNFSSDKIMEDSDIFEDGIMSLQRSEGIDASVGDGDIQRDLYDWVLYSGSWYSAEELNPKRRIGTSLHEGFSDAIVEAMELINIYSKQRGRLIEFKEILYCYWRHHPINGIEFVLDLLLVYRKYRGHKMTIQVRRHAYIQQSFTGLYIKSRDSPVENETPEIFEKSSIPIHEQMKLAIISLQQNLKPLLKFGDDNSLKTINFILPLCGRYQTFERFMKIYENVCLTPQEYTSLNIILYTHPDSVEDLKKSENLIKIYRNKFPGKKITTVYKNEQFSRGKSLQYGVDLFQNDDLMFFVDVDMVFTEQTLKRIRLNTVLNSSIYFPIVFSLYNPRISEKITVNSVKCETSEGFWRHFGFGLVSLYKNDYLQVGGFNLMISGWGFEDVTFYDKVIKTKHLQIVRTTDPSLVHVYHQIRCDSSLDVTQRDMCLGTEAGALGGLESLQQIYKTHKSVIESKFSN